MKFGFTFVSFSSSNRMPPVFASVTCVRKLDCRWLCCCRCRCCCSRCCGGRCCRCSRVVWIFIWVVKPEKRLINIFRVRNRNGKFAEFRTESEFRQILPESIFSAFSAGIFRNGSESIFSKKFRRNKSEWIGIIFFEKAFICFLLSRQTCRLHLLTSSLMCFFLQAQSSAAF